MQSISLGRYCYQQAGDLKLDLESYLNLISQEQLMFSHFILGCLVRSGLLWLGFKMRAWHLNCRWKYLAMFDLVRLDVELNIWISCYPLSPWISILYVHLQDGIWLTIEFNYLIWAVFIWKFKSRCVIISSNLAGITPILVHFSSSINDWEFSIWTFWNVSKVTAFHFLHVLVKSTYYHAIPIMDT